MGWKENVTKIKDKGSKTISIIKLQLKKNSLKKDVSKMHTRIGERVDYLLQIGKEKIEEDEVIKGFIQEIKNLRNQVEDIKSEIEKLKEEKEEKEKE